MKKFYIWVLVPLLISAEIIGFIQFGEDNLLVLVFSGIVFIVMLNLFMQVFIYKGKNQRLFWVTSKLKDTQDTLNKLTNKVNNLKLRLITLQKKPMYSASGNLTFY